MRATAKRERITGIPLTKFASEMWHRDKPVSGYRCRVITTDRHKELAVVPKGMKGTVRFYDHVTYTVQWDTFQCIYALWCGLHWKFLFLMFIPHCLYLRNLSRGRNFVMGNLIGDFDLIGDVQEPMKAI